MFTSRNVVQDRLEQRAIELREAADTLARGDAREALLHRALKMDAAALVTGRWISPPGVKGALRWPSSPGGSNHIAH
jgi:hypothetical protein